MNAYKQIDFGRESFSPEVGKTIPGLYDRIEESEKVILDIVPHKAHDHISIYILGGKACRY